MKKYVVIAAFTALAACDRAPAITTASGKPDVLMRAVDRTCVRETILNNLLTNGWSIKSTSEVQIVVERQAPPSMAAALLSTGYSGAPYQRVTFNLVPSGPDLRLVADMAWVSNANTRFEKVHPAQANANDQAAAESSARRAEAKCVQK
ncbi:hypothetical protein [Reyranella sp.]|jgi:hypothetical protein|uniref:hypothetical protein n=1 Tax=Reyranella sp. TaxID=1929291 RepID=UPI000BDC84B3|nr:hypothetical protein [Reyranella sp.]OYY40493.1 MAG: hypothetical protein B7Y57_17445 [Rhodospirillales bacterium 35-66-84]OYZ93110.1 MAG: hypothetical protein B7Y08_18695 [Rhodospirillales bacterium 24-66-33]OZB24238.1 MAG: hypothetical protein B7X63_16655 [Rhodospirillales bacterium 39-66-50]HQS18635.1 hypothetical protein [Reyranella sp.]HQT14853.1 hypothetical protein [Reyranella sp.]